ncbi:MAG: pitrilysin family protein, partial [Atribacterota bacterium]
MFPFPYTKKVFPGGLRVIFHQKASPLVAFNLWAGVGVKDESLQTSGLSHFYEHMVFKGTTHFPGALLSRQIQAIGGTMNAGTSLDTTDFYIQVPREYWKEGLRLEAELLLRPLFEPPEIEREKMVILQEIHLDDDDPEEKLVHLLYENVFAGTPYGMSILGTEESVDRFHRDHLLQHQRGFFHPGNLTLSVCGDVKEEEIFSETERIFFPQDLPAVSVSSPFPSLRLPERKYIEAKMDIHRFYGAIGFFCPGVKEDDFYPLRLLSVVMGDGIGSRLNVRLREQDKLVDAIHSTYSYYKKAGLFSINFTYTEGEKERVEDTIREECLRFLTHPPREEELVRARNLLLSGFYHSIETTLGTAELLGRFDTIDTIDTIWRY